MHGPELIVDSGLPRVNCRALLFIDWHFYHTHPSLTPIGFQAAVIENSSISCLIHDCHPSVWMMNSQEKYIWVGLRQLAFTFMRHQENENCSTCEGVALKGSLFNRIERRVTITAVETREVSLGESLTFSRSPFSRESSFLKARPNNSASAWTKGAFCGSSTLVSMQRPTKTHCFLEIQLKLLWFEVLEPKSDWGTWKHGVFDFLMTLSRSCFGHNHVLVSGLGFSNLQSLQHVTSQHQRRYVVKIHRDGCEMFPRLGLS